MTATLRHRDFLPSYFLVTAAVALLPSCAWGQVPSDRYLGNALAQRGAQEIGRPTRLDAGVPRAGADRGDRGFSVSEGDSEAQEAAVGGSAPELHRKSYSQRSTLDGLLGSDDKTPPGVDQLPNVNGLFSEFESAYAKNADDTGHLPVSVRRPDQVADKIAQVLPREYGVQASCVQQRRRDSRVSGSSQANAIASVMYDILDQFAPPSKGGLSGDMLRQRIGYLSQPAMGCPSDFSAIKLFLEDYTEFAKEMVSRRKERATERKAKIQEASEALDRPSPKAIKNSAVFAVIESSYQAPSDDRSASPPSASINHVTLSNTLARILPDEYGISERCLVEPRRDSRTGTSQAMGVARAMAYAFDYHWVKQYGQGDADSSKFNREIDNLSRTPPFGCPEDFDRVWAFLEDFSVFASSLIARKEAEVQAIKKAKLERQRAQQVQDAARTAALRSGREKPTSYRDYWLLHSPAQGNMLFYSPPLSGSKHVIVLSGVVERQMDDGVILKMGDVNYVRIRIPRGTPTFVEMKLNYAIAIIGTHTGNGGYTTVRGVEKTLAVVEAIAIGPANLN